MTFRSTPYTPYDSSGWDDSSRPADSDELPQDVYRHHAEVVLQTGEAVTKTGRVLTEADFEALADEAERGYDVSDWDEPETYAEAIGLDDYDVVNDR